MTANPYGHKSLKSKKKEVESNDDLLRKAKLRLLEIQTKIKTLKTDNPLYKSLIKGALYGLGFSAAGTISALIASKTVQSLLVSGYLSLFLLVIFVPLGVICAFGYWRSELQGLRESERLENQEITKLEKANLNSQKALPDLDIPSKPLFTTIEEVPLLSDSIPIYSP